MWPIGIGGTVDNNDDDDDDDDGGGGGDEGRCTKFWS